MHLLRSPGSVIEKELKQWKEMTTSVTSSNEDIYRLFKQSRGGHGRVAVAAGRDAAPLRAGSRRCVVFTLAVTLGRQQNMIVYPDFPRGALDVLGRLHGC